ncbi:NHLP leader peptide family RiPP precursor [Paraburkholderia sp. EG285A]|uniref:NHLP leader peptide family RiPP precursor n=1 Tax=Paraburkholderia sp. EG285A TaxID=3237009 RepID=UPI0034D21D2A
MTDVAFVLPGRRGQQFQPAIRGFPHPIYSDRPLRKLRVFYALILAALPSVKPLRRRQRIFSCVLYDELCVHASFGRPVRASRCGIAETSEGEVSPSRFETSHEVRIPMSNSDKLRIVAATVIAQAWRDPAYKASVLQNPKAALATAGLTLPDSVQVSALENTVLNKYIVLPAQERLQADPVAGAKLLKAIAPLPKGTRVTLLQDTADTRHFVIPVAPPNSTLQAHTDATAATAMAEGYESVNLYTTANAVGEANAAGVSNVAGATEGVVVAVGAAVLT